MYWPLSPDAINTVLQMAVCFFSLVGFLFSFVLTARA